MFRTVKTLLIALPVLVLPALVLVGCTGAPLPKDEFYRLPAAEPSKARSEIVVYGGMRVEAPVTDPVHQERAMLFSSDPEGLRLEQHGYQSWVDNAPRLIQSNIIEYMRKSNFADWVGGAEQERFAVYEVTGRLHQFERHSMGKGHQVVVDMVLTLRRDGRRSPLVRKRYHQTHPIDGTTPVDMARGLRLAMAGLLDQFMADSEQAIAADQAVK